MIEPGTLEQELCTHFCVGLTVRAVPIGLAISTVFKDSSGDRLGFYAVREADGWRLEDDGAFLATLAASGVDLENNQRGELLSRLLDEGSASWDRDDMVIRSHKVFADQELANGIIPFLASLLRARDMALMTRDAIRSTFRDDARAAIVNRLGQLAEIGDDQAVDEGLRDFPSDFVVRPNRGGRPAAVFVVTRNERLTEALLLQAEARARRRDLAVVALLEDAERRLVSAKNFQRALNRLSAMPIFRGDEQAAVETIARAAGIELGEAAPLF